MIDSFIGYQGFDELIKILVCWRTLPFCLHWTLPFCLHRLGVRNRFTQLRSYTVTFLIKLQVLEFGQANDSFVLVFHSGRFNTFHHFVCTLIHTSICVLFRLDLEFSWTILRCNSGGLHQVLNCLITSPLQVLVLIRDGDDETLPQTWDRPEHKPTVRGQPSIVRLLLFSSQSDVRLNQWRYVIGLNGYILLLHGFCYVLVQHWL